MELRWLRCRTPVSEDSCGNGGSQAPAVGQGFARMSHDEQPTILLGARVIEGVQRELALRYRLLGPLGGPFAESVMKLDAAERRRVRIIVTAPSMAIDREAMSALPN